MQSFDRSFSDPLYSLEKTELESDLSQQSPSRNNNNTPFVVSLIKKKICVPNPRAEVKEGTKPIDKKEKMI